MNGVTNLGNYVKLNVVEGKERKIQFWKKNKLKVFQIKSLNIAKAFSSGVVLAPAEVVYDFVILGYYVFLFS